MVIRHPMRRRHRSHQLYQITDCLHDDRTALVPASDIATIVSTWLAELEIRTPLVQDLASAACAGDWASVHAIGEHLSVRVTPAERRCELGEVND